MDHSLGRPQRATVGLPVDQWQDDGVGLVIQLQEKELQKTANPKKLWVREKEHRLAVAAPPHSLLVQCEEMRVQYATSMPEHSSSPPLNRLSDY